MKMRNAYIRFYRYLSFLKAIFYKFRVANILLCLVAFKVKSARAWCYPALVQIEPTNRCNLHCKLCPTGQKHLNRALSDLSLEQFQSIIDCLESSLAYLVLYVAGEPLLNKDILKMIGYAKKKNIYIRFSTNATNSCFGNGRGIKELVDSGVDELIIALDCIDRGAYEDFKGYDGFLEVSDNVQKIIRERGKRPAPFIHLQSIVTKDNESDLKKFLCLGKGLNVDKVSFKTVCINLYGFNGQEKYLPSRKEYVRGVYLRDDNPGSCFKPWISTTVLSNGSIVPCCFDMDGDWSFGNIFAEGFKKTWNNDAYTAFRKAVLCGPGELDLCQGCPGKNIPRNFIKGPR